VKAAALNLALESSEHPNVTHSLVHTGQHYDFNMSELLFEQLKLPEPSHNLGVGSGGHGAQTGEILKRLEPILIEEKPNLVLVYGDTNSTLAAALCATKLHLPIAHVEAGLRSFNRHMPEEVNRVVTDHVSQFLLCPSDRAMRNLELEGIRTGVSKVGDLMYDILLFVRAQIDLRPSSRGEGPTFALATVHRAENTEDLDKFGEIVEAMSLIARQGLPVVWPVHPRVRSLIDSFDIDPGVSLIDPVGYLDMVRLLSECSVVMTDSGGLQKEAMWSSAPCVTVRDETEWEETIALGWNRLVRTDRSAISRAVIDARPVAGGVPDVYGTGNAAEAIVDVLLASGS